MVAGKKGMVINMIYVAVMGHGVVGSGVVEVPVSYTHLKSLTLCLPPRSLISVCMVWATAGEKMPKPDAVNGLPKKAFSG